MSSGKSDPYDILNDDWKALSDDDLLIYFGDVYWGWKVMQHKLDSDDTAWPTQAAYDADQATEESYALHYTMVQAEIKRRDIGW